MKKSLFLIIPAIFVCCVLSFSMLVGGEHNTRVLSEYNGKVALFENGSDNPSQVFEINIKSLPNYDRNNLKKGIPITNDAQLAQLIEDFDG